MEGNALPCLRDYSVGVLALEPSGEIVLASFWSDELSSMGYQRWVWEMRWLWVEQRQTPPVRSPGAVTKANIWRLGLLSSLLGISRLSEAGINLEKFTSRVLWQIKQFAYFTLVWPPARNCLFSFEFFN